MFISPKNDYAFKKIFGSEDSKEILISFLNAIIYQERSLIQDLTPHSARRNIPIQHGRMC